MEYFDDNGNQYVHAGTIRKGDMIVNPEGQKYGVIPEPVLVLDRLDEGRSSIVAVQLDGVGHQTTMNSWDVVLRAPRRKA